MSKSYQTWPRHPLGKLAVIQSGGTPDRTNKAYWVAGTVPWVTTGEVNYSLINDTKERITLDGLANSSAKIFPKGTILMALYGQGKTRGKVGLLGIDASTNQACAAIQPKNCLDVGFLYEFLKASYVSIRVLSNLGGQQNLSSTLVSEILIPLPPISEQHRIAEILRTWDEAIEKLEALRVAMKSRYRTLARRFFDPCHPSFHTRQNSWCAFELGDLFHERVQYSLEENTLLSITMSEGVIDRKDVGRKDTSKKDKSRYKLILPGDIGYNTMRMWQGVSGLSAHQGIVSPAYTIVTPDNRNIAASYAAHLFKSRRMTFDFERYSQGLTSDTWNLKFPAFAKIQVFLPPLDLQKKQSKLLDEIKKEIEIVVLQCEALYRQKRGLMQKLLTGEWRVNSNDYRSSGIRGRK